MRRRLTIPALLLGCVLSAGCASSPAEPASGAVQTTSLPTAPRARKGLTPTPLAPEPIGRDPYAKRPGAEQKGERPDPGPLPFDAPTQAERSPARRARKLPSPAKLAVAFVRDGSLRGDAEALLTLGELLHKDPDLAAVLAVGRPQGPSASLTSLAKQAQSKGCDLLLVEVVETGGEREAFLLTAAGELVARYEGAGQRPLRVDRKGEEALVLRLSQALERLRS